MSPSLRALAALVASSAAVFLLAAGAGAHNPTIVSLSNPGSAGDRFGEGVARIKDANGAGYLAVGAPKANRVYVFSASGAHALVRTISDPAPFAAARFGYSVSSAGDVDGDGVDDVAVGAPGPEGFIPLPCMTGCPDPNWGRAFVFSGKNGTLLRTLVPTDQDFAAFGVSLAPLGDVNGDGTPDLAVGAPVLLHYWGEVYAFSGANGAQLWNTQEPGPSPGERQPIASFGSYSAPVGDLTGDGKRDLIVGAQFHDADPDPAKTLLAGRAYVLSGANGAIVRTHDDPTPAATNDAFGAGVSGVGDQTGDGIEDYAVAELGVGKVHLFNGASGALIRTIATPGGAVSSQFGLSIARAGDKTGDGVGDFWIAAPAAGKVYLFDGLGAKLAEISGTAASNGGFGWQIAQTDNLGGDAGPDLLVGAPAQDAAYIVMLPPPNSAPVVAAGQSAVTVSEGSTATASGTVSDPDGDALTLAASSGTVTDNGNGTWSWSLPTLDGPTDSRVVTITATDEHGAAASMNFQLVVTNVGPSVGAPVASTADAVLVGTTVGVSAPFSDSSPVDTHTATIDWGDGTIVPAAVLESSGSGSASGTHAYTAAGIYTVTVTATDDDGGTGAASTSIVVYDPDAGFVTAGGSLFSPAGADLEHPSASGKATFGLGARYTSTTRLSGSFELRFPAGDLRFESTELKWLVVLSEPRAVLHGKGVLNGAVACSFTADLHAATVAIEISACSSGAAARYSLPATPPASGSIQIHLGK